ILETFSMSIKNNTTSTTTTSRRTRRWDPLVESEKQKFCIQSKPPLSLRQFLRSTITSNSDGKHWKPTGMYHGSLVVEEPPSKAPDTLPKIIIKGRKDSRPVWSPPGVVKFKRPASSKEENKPPKSEHTLTESEDTRVKVTPWYPSGNPYYEPVTYFDAPSLRWSSQQIKQSIPEFKSIPNNSSTNPKSNHRTKRNLSQRQKDRCFITKAVWLSSIIILVPNGYILSYALNIHPFSNQPCEATFRTARSLSGILFTITNFPVAQFMIKIEKISILNQVKSIEAAGDAECSLRFPVITKVETKKALRL
ncbi:unnamed protein product, partial [Adineta steineri]